MGLGLGLGLGLGMRGKGAKAAQPLQLDTYSGAAAAYSLRKLSNDYSGSAIRVRRSSDNTEQDIGFNGVELDTATLLSLVGAGSGFVTTWYDQSGNANNTTQTTAANQPKIVDAGVIVKENGKPAIDFDGMGDGLIGVIGITQPITSFAVQSGTKSDNTVYDGSGMRSFLRSEMDNQSSVFAGTLLGTVPLSLSNYKLLYGLFNGVNSEVTYNSQAVSTGDAGTNGLGSILIGAGSAFAEHEGNIQEIIIYNSDQSANRSGIETNINDHYNIY